MLKIGAVYPQISDKEMIRINKFVDLLISKGQIHPDFKQVAVEEAVETFLEMRLKGSDEFTSGW